MILIGLKRCLNKLKKKLLQSCLFLDRDGVINYDYGHVYKKEDIIFLPNIFELVKIANKQNILVIIITNQAGIAKGLYTESDFIKLNNWMKNQFKMNNCYIDDVYFCPFHQEAIIEKYKKDSFYRKPNPGMLIKAAIDYSIDLKKSMIIGDNESDMLAGKSLKLKYNLLINNKKSGNYYMNISSHLESIKYLKYLRDC